MTDLETYTDDLVAHEGCVTYLYQDTRGNVTVGVGELVPNVTAAQALPLWAAADGRATADQIRREWSRVVGIAQSLSSPYSSAHWYSDDGLYMGHQECLNRCGARVTSEFLPACRRLFTGFDGYPLNARRVIVDMAWNLGEHGLSQFTGLRAACEAGNWTLAGAETHRHGGSDRRNRWALLTMSGAGGQTS